MAMNLSVNLNKVALLRNSRGGDNPAPRRAAEVCIDAGVAGLTLHWRQDNRHTREEDVRALCALCQARGVEFNLEGDARPQLVELALELGVTQFTLVPVTPGEITSDHGWDLPREASAIAPIIERCKAHGIRTAIFVDPRPDLMQHAAATGVDRVEIYTEPYARTFGGPAGEPDFLAFRDTARAATALGVGVNAGHDLDLVNLPRVAEEIPEVLEVSIGHALLADALYWGLEKTVKAYLAATRGERLEPPRTR